MEPLSLLIGLIAGALLGALVTLIIARTRSGRTDADAAPVEDPAVTEARHQLALGDLRSQEQSARAAVEAELASVEASATALREQVATLQQHNRELLDRERTGAEERAARERREAEERAARERSESKVLQALTPVQETLRTMQEKVTELEKERSTQYGSLAEQLKQAQLSDEQLRVTTETLASALRSNSTRGVWGETQLQRIVEAAGLTQYVDYYTQTSITTDAGAGRPDMVVRLPGNKSIAIDSKVPLEHYIEASQISVAAVGEEADRRTRLIDRHVKAVRSHVDALAKKTYWEGFDASPEFVIAFIPSESLLSSALEADPALLEYAFGKRVALASPVNLWAVLKTVAFTWQQQAVSDEAKKLFDLGNTLYQRLGVLTGHAESLRRAIERTVDSYNKFASSLESRVLVTARQFPGIDETKLDVVAEPEQIHSSPRRLTADELTTGPSDTETAELEAGATETLTETEVESVTEETDTVIEQTEVEATAETTLPTGDEVDGLDLELELEGLDTTERQNVT